MMSRIAPPFVFFQPHQVARTRAAVLRTSVYSAILKPDSSFREQVDPPVAGPAPPTAATAVAPATPVTTTSAASTTSTTSPAHSDQVSLDTETQTEDIASSSDTATVTASSPAVITAEPIVEPIVPLDSPTSVYSSHTPQSTPPPSPPWIPLPARDPVTPVNQCEVEFGPPRQWAPRIRFKGPRCPNSPVTSPRTVEADRTLLNSIIPPYSKDPRVWLDPVLDPEDPTKTILLAPAEITNEKADPTFPKFRKLGIYLIVLEIQLDDPRLHVDNRIY